MTNIRTAEGREELRRQFKETGMVPINVRQALDGLDIAEEMAEAIQYDGKMLTIHSNLPDVLRRWQAWERGEDNG